MTPHANWLVLPLLLLMQAGFALVTTGLCRAKNSGHAASANLVVLVFFAVAFWIFGFALLFGGLPLYPNLDHEWLGIAGMRGFFFSPSAGDADSISLFGIGALLLAVAAVIPAAAMAERWNLKNIVVYAIWVAFPLAIYGNWVWGGGWLSRLGKEWGLGHGVVDFAGSSVVHMAGGIIGFVGSNMLGARAGKYSRDGRPKPMPGHNLIFVVAGTLLLFAGWFGFNSASPFTGEEMMSTIGLNTLLAGGAGGAAAYLATVRKFGKADPSMLCNGILAGLVAISASCAYVNAVGAVLTGIVAGVIVVNTVLLFEGRVKVDDPVGAISVHGICGVWGLLSLGLFADGRFGGIAGAFGKIFGAPASDWSQLGAQCVGAIVCVVFFAAAAFVGFKASSAITPLRVRRDTEMGGLDLPETGAECYPDFHLTDKGQGGV